MTTLSDSIAARLATQRNPNISTDQGLNSVSPYFLPTGSSDSSTPAGAASSWATTNDAIAQSQAVGQAKVQAAADLKASQDAAAQLAKQNAANEAAAQKAAAAQAKANAAALTAAKKSYDSLSKQVASLKQSASGSYSSSAGMDAESQRMLATAKSYGYNLSAANYSKSYQSNPNLSAARNKAMMIATSYLGTEYALGGTTQNSIDCSGLVMAVYNQLGFGITEHHAAWQGQHIPGTRTAVTSGKLKAGDIVAWKSGDHIAIFAGYRGGVPWIIEAANTRVGTVERPLWDSPSNVVGIHLNL